MTDEIRTIAQLPPAALAQSLGSSVGGLRMDDAAARLVQYGPNDVAHGERLSYGKRLWSNLINPLVLLLGGLAVVSYLTGDQRATVVIVAMIVLGVVLRFFQELRADASAEKLRALVSQRARVWRDGQLLTLPVQRLVPGDVVTLGAGDMIPADVRILESTDFYVNQSTLTGEALPVAKDATTLVASDTAPFDIGCLAFFGSYVRSGRATAMVIRTGGQTFFGQLAASVVATREASSFDRGIDGFTWLMIRFIVVMVPIVFVVNWYTTADWWGAFLFASAVAVGLTPEMLPMIVSVNLSRGAQELAKRRVIVKRLNALQNFGAMDVLCTDKTGTLTAGTIVLHAVAPWDGSDTTTLLRAAYRNSALQSGLQNALDEAVCTYVGSDGEPWQAGVTVVDEVPFDFDRRRLSVVVDIADERWLICKGAVDETLACCTAIVTATGQQPLTNALSATVTAWVDAQSAAGSRVMAVAHKALRREAGSDFTVADEADLLLLGFLLFRDPPKETTPAALAALAGLHIDVKILTGDTPAIARAVCGQVGLPVERVLSGTDVAAMDAATLQQAVVGVTVFAKLTPDQKERIIRALQFHGHTVGFLGDGINDAPALKAADVGISVDSAADIAKESSDLILLEQDLGVLEQGVRQGRQVFGNIIKYIRMAASSNFGNMFSMLGASALLPFVPMTPIQILLNNLLYDISQTAIPTDRVDPEWVARPRRWELGKLQQYILMVGPMSTLFDIITFAILWYGFGAGENPTFFQTAWFIESIFSQTLVIHVIRTDKIPFLQSMASWPLTLSSLGILAIAGWLTVSPFADALGFVALPWQFWVINLLLLLAYIPLTQLSKMWYQRRYGDVVPVGG